MSALALEGTPNTGVTRDGVTQVCRSLFCTSRYSGELKRWSCLHDGRQGHTSHPMKYLEPSSKCIYGSLKKQNQDLLEEKVQCARSRRLAGLTTSHADGTCTSFIPTTAEPQLLSTCVCQVRPEGDTYSERKGGSSGFYLQACHISSGTLKKETDNTVTCHLWGRAGVQVSANRHVSFLPGHMGLQGVGGLAISIKHLVEVTPGRYPRATEP